MFLCSLNLTAWTIFHIEFCFSLEVNVANVKRAKFQMKRFPVDIKRSVRLSVERNPVFGD